MAFNAWRNHGSILKAANDWQVDPDDIIMWFREHQPWRYRWFEFRLEWAVSLALLLAMLNDIKRDLRRYVANLLGGRR